VACRAVLEQRDRRTPSRSTTMPRIGDTVRVHHGAKVGAWLGDHPRCVCQCLPVHCSWMNPVAPWFSIRRRKRLRRADVAHLADRAATIAPFIDQWNDIAHPLQWTMASFETVLATAEAAIPHDTPRLQVA
jgi:hypothetical protein